MENAKLPNNFYKNYKIFDGKTAPPEFLMYNWDSLGWDDPFENDEGTYVVDAQEPTKYNDWVYPEFRYKKGFSPYCIYIPTKEMMLKIMRACIGVKKKEDLWINCEKIE